MCVCDSTVQHCTSTEQYSRYYTEPCSALTYVMVLGDTIASVCLCGHTHTHTRALWTFAKHIMSPRSNLSCQESKSRQESGAQHWQGQEDVFIPPHEASVKDSDESTAGLSSNNWLLIIKEVSAGRHVEKKKKKNMVVVLLWTCTCTCYVFVPELFPPRGSPHGLLAGPVRSRLTCSVILCNLSQSCLARYSNLSRQPLHLCSVSTQ